MTPIATWVADSLYWVFLGILIVNLTQRKHQEQAQKKRFATLYIGLAVFALYVVAQAIEAAAGRDWMLLPGAVVIGLVVHHFRDHVWPFRLHCTNTGKRLTWQEFLYDDSNTSASPDSRDGSSRRN